MGNARAEKFFSTGCFRNLSNFSFLVPTFSPKVRKHLGAAKSNYMRSHFGKHVMYERREGLSVFLAYARFCDLDVTSY